MPISGENAFGAYGATGDSGSNRPLLTKSGKRSGEYDQPRGKASGGKGQPRGGGGKDQPRGDGGKASYAAMAGRAMADLTDSSQMAAENGEDASYLPPSSELLVAKGQ